MTDPGLQLDFFQRVRKPRRQMMAYRDRGWNCRGEEVCWFECPKCGAKSGMRKWPHADCLDGPPCESKTCKEGK